MADESQPETNAAPGARDLAAFAFELGVLKNLPRTGWAHIGHPSPESVAAHSARVAQLAAIIAAEEGADPKTAAFFGIWHDSQETRIGDIPHTAKPFIGTVDNNAVTAQQTARLPRRSAETIQRAVAEYEAQDSLEARCAKDADKLECLLQALEYRAAGFTTVQGWIDSSHAGLKTDTALRIADAAVELSPLSWRNR